jgi:hypothetical protein
VTSNHHVSERACAFCCHCASIHFTTPVRRIELVSILRTRQGIRSGAGGEQSPLTSTDGTIRERPQPASDIKSPCVRACMSHFCSRRLCCAVRHQSQSWQNRTTLLQIKHEKTRNQTGNIKQPRPNPVRIACAFALARLC